MEKITEKEAIDEVKSWTPVLISMGGNCTEKTLTSLHALVTAGSPE